MLEYGYEEYRKNAIENPTQENLQILANWLWLYGNSYWNGETWDIDNGLRLRPHYNEELEDYDKYEII